MTLCEETLGPGLAAYQELTDAGKFCDLKAFDDNLAALCRGATGEARNRALAAADKRMLCAVLCCCSKQPTVAASGSGRSGYQTCADRTFAAAEKHMGNNSRFKPEVSYNMRTNPPTPLMEKSMIRRSLTTKSIPWNRGGIEHIKNRISEQGGPYRAGDARRPDITIVRDPSLPPTASNISRIVDFKFGNDSLTNAQRAAYSRIGGIPPLVLSEQDCDCADDEQTKGQMSLVTASQDIRERDRSFLTRLGWGALGTVAALGAVALAIFPLDGPVGEAAAGAGSLAAFSRAFAAAGWSTARRQAATALAGQRWRQVYAGGF